MKEVLKIDENDLTKDVSKNTVDGQSDHEPSNDDGKDENSQNDQIKE